jgi:NAD-dependent dihydropyrimidine dehydrogenase PreA subunit
VCEFCHKHGEGEKWYLQAKNYGEDLLSDLRRRHFIKEFFLSADRLQQDFAGLDRLEQVPPALRGAVGRLVTSRMKREHFGQVVPMEDLERIFGLVNSVVRLPCICRYVTNHHSDARYCYGIAAGPGTATVWSELLDEVDSSFMKGPDTTGLEPLDKETALAALRDHEREGLCHTIWTFLTPFIGGVCNCDRADCMAMQSTVVHGVKVMFRAEYVAAADPDRCTGCRACMRLCQFGALGFSAANKKVYVDQRACYGCGVCRAACAQEAISLRPRREVPVVASVW